MSAFNPALDITSTGTKEIGNVPSYSISILSIGVTGTVGVFVGDTFFPHADGAIIPGQMFTFDIGAGRSAGISVTSGTGKILSAAV